MAMHSVFGKGQLLFLTRKLSAEDTANMLNAGYKLASVQHIGRNVAETMQIPLTVLETHISNLNRYVENLSTLEKPGTWLSCFAMIPKANSKGFDIAVKKTEHDQLPDVQLSTFGPTEWQVRLLERMHNLSPFWCINFLEDPQDMHPARPFRDHQFALVVQQAIQKLSQQLPSSWFQNARFYGKPVHAHYSQPLRNNAPVTTLYSFVVCADLHTSIEAYGSVTSVPLSFFNVRQHCYSGSPNHAVLVREIHKEFSALLARKTGKNEKDDKVKKISIHLPHKMMPKSRRPSATHSGSERSNSDDWFSDTHELVDGPRNFSEITEDTAASDRNIPFGGILVNSETVMKTDSKMAYSSDTMGPGYGLRTAVGISQPEETFVDELFAFGRGTIMSRAAN